MMHKIQFQKCTINEVAILLPLARQTFINTYAAFNDPGNFQSYLDLAFNEDRLRMELSTPNSAFFLCLLENQPVGYCKLNEGEAQTEKGYPNSLEIERIYVLQAFKGQGIGKAMIGLSKRTAIEKDLHYIWLGVWEKNPNAIAFYQKMGFNKIGTHHFQLGTEEQLDYVMELKL